MNTFWKIIAIFILIGAVAVVIRLISRDDSGGKVIIRQYTVRNGNIEKTVQGTGILRCAERMEVVSEIKGKIKKINVKEGQNVSKGDSLAEIDNKEIDDEINVQKAIVEKLKKEFDEIIKDPEEQVVVITARLARDQAKLEYDTKQKELSDEEARVAGGATPKYSKDDMERLKKEVSALKEKYLLAERQYEEAKPTEAEKKEAEGKYNKEKEKLTLLEKAASGRNMISPINGTILKIYIDEETLKINPDKEYEIGTPFFLIANLDSLIVEGTVFESDIGKLKLEQTVKVFLSNQSRTWHQGKLSKISLTPGKEPGRFEIRISFDTPPKGVKEGIRVNFQIIVEKLDDVLIIPIEYIKHEGQKKYVYLLEMDKKVKREVKLGSNDTHSYQVIDGLKEGEKIILEMKAVE